SDAEEFGFKVWYGDGTRMDVLHAAGAHEAVAILVCIDDAAAATRIAEQAKHTFHQAKVIVRSRDREHAIALIGVGADAQVRETFESAMAIGREATRALGATPEISARIDAEVRRRDSERFDLELAGGLLAGRDRIIGNRDTAH
ncbi:MAG: NAD-binding protein, partial [Lautropia sp.]